MTAPGPWFGVTRPRPMVLCVDGPHHGKRIALDPGVTVIDVAVPALTLTTLPERRGLQPTVEVLSHRLSFYELWRPPIVGPEPDRARHRQVLLFENGQHASDSANLLAKYADALVQQMRGAGDVD